MNLSPPELSFPRATVLSTRAEDSRAPEPQIAAALRVAHLLRKCNPAEWGGTETAVQRLLQGLHEHGVRSVVYCPRIDDDTVPDPLAHCGCTVRRFHAFVPIVGIPPEQRRQLIAVGGNLMSLDLLGALWRERVSLIHSHTLGRLGAIASAVARRRGVPFVITIHGGFLDLPERLKNDFWKPATRGWEWGKIFGLALGSRHLMDRADAILTCNPKEAALLRERQPAKRIVVQPHAVPLKIYQTDHRVEARAAFPQIRRRQVILCVGRIDAVKNQRWLVEEAPAIFQRHPQALLVLAGACTDEAYGESLRRRVSELGLDGRVLFTGGLPPGDARLLGLFQEARVVALPSVSETFGLVLLEAWAAGTPVVASRTSGASALVQNGQNGWLFDLDTPRAFHQAIDALLLKPELAARMAAEGGRLVREEYDSAILAGRMQMLYEDLIEEKHALRHSARR